jgi:TatD DNase family protein
MQADWARRVNKPLVVHVRDAMEDALAALHGLPFDAGELRLLFHCYAGGTEYLGAMRDLGAYMSLGGPVTWPKNDDLRKVAALIPEDRLLCETDAPWLTPEPYRGRPNEPAFVRFVYETLADVRGVAVEALAKSTDANAARLFGWEPLYV